MLLSDKQVLLTDAERTVVMQAVNSFGRGPKVSAFGVEFLRCDYVQACLESAIEWSEGEHVSDKRIPIAQRIVRKLQ